MKGGKRLGTAGNAARISFLLILFACFYAFFLFISLDVQVRRSSRDLVLPQRILLFHFGAGLI